MNGVWNCMYVMAKVKPKQQQTADQYQTWILCNRHGECSHLAVDVWQSLQPICSLCLQYKCGRAY